MKENCGDTFLFSPTPDKYIFSILNLLSPDDSYILFNDYSNKLLHINNLSPNKNKIKKSNCGEYCISNLVESLSFEFFEFFGSPLSSNHNNYFSLKKGVPVKNEKMALDFFVFINMLIRKMMLLKLAEIGKLSFFDRLSARVNFLKMELIKSIGIIDNRLMLESSSDSSPDGLILNKINKKNKKNLSFNPSKKTISKRLNVLKIASFSNNSLSASEIHNCLREKFFLSGYFDKDVFYIRDDFSIKKISFLFSVTSGVLLGRNISQIKNKNKTTPFLLKTCFYLPSETNFDKSVISNVSHGVNGVLESENFVFFDDAEYSFELLNPYEHYMMFVVRNMPSIGLNFFNDIVPTGFYESRASARSVVSELNNMLINNQLFVLDHICFDEDYDAAIKNRNSIISEKVEKLEKIKANNGAI